MCIRERFQNDIGKPLLGHRFAAVFFADLKILAKAAAQRAAAEKYGAAARRVGALAADAGLFPEVERGPGQTQLICAAAGAGCAGAVCAAAARAKGAVFISGQKITRFL